MLWWAKRVVRGASGKDVAEAVVDHFAHEPKVARFWSDHAKTTDWVGVLVDQQINRKRCDVLLAAAFVLGTTTFRWLSFAQACRRDRIDVAHSVIKNASQVNAHDATILAQACLEHHHNVFDLLTEHCTEAALTACTLRLCRTHHANPHINDGLRRVAQAFGRRHTDSGGSWRDALVADLGVCLNVTLRVVRDDTVRDLCQGPHGMIWAGGFLEAAAWSDRDGLARSIMAWAVVDEESVARALTAACLARNTGLAGAIVAGTAPMGAATLAGVLDMASHNAPDSVLDMLLAQAPHDVLMSTCTALAHRQRWNALDRLARLASDTTRASIIRSWPQVRREPGFVAWRQARVLTRHVRPTQASTPRKM